MPVVIQDYLGNCHFLSDDARALSSVPTDSNGMFLDYHRAEIGTRFKWSALPSRDISCKKFSRDIDPIVPDIHQHLSQNRLLILLLIIQYWILLPVRTTSSGHLHGATILLSRHSDTSYKKAPALKIFQEMQRSKSSNSVYGVSTWHNKEAKNNAGWNISLRRGPISEGFPVNLIYQIFPLLYKASKREGKICIDKWILKGEVFWKK